MEFPRDVRRELAKKLIDSLEDELEPPDGVEAAWAREAEQRLASALAGKSKSVPAKTALKQVRRRIHAKG